MAKKSTDKGDPPKRRAWAAWVAVVAGLAAAAAFIGNIKTMNESVLQPIIEFGQGRQPRHDERILNDLRAGIDAAAFEKMLGVERTTLVHKGLKIDQMILEDRFFILETVYVEEFVDQNGIVRAYTITARQEPLPQEVQVAGRTFSLGKTRIDEAGFTGIARIGSVCAAHVQAYFEVSETSEAELQQTTAVGSTVSGTAPQGGWQDCAPDEAFTRGLRPGSKPYSKYDNKYTIDEYNVDDRVLVRIADYRHEAIVNSVAVTSYGVPLIPEMISLHPQDVMIADKEYFQINHPEDPGT